ncbi:MAG TPA: SDR family NAD(P)-dependent oxidoreductase [Chthoniobacterales bacterium]|jgi:NAD(P)-dependent dehydrogenase (short-subunit alcohol dehydrogenase family)|nr:SDR family NAD(P)-dependent oxidoreductase [Chthoniobacterales bacterium]
MSSNRVALLTGVGPGLGASLARRFTRGGFSLGLVARHSNFIEKLAGELLASGGHAIAVVADVSQPEEVKSAIARVRAKLGKIDLLLHNASSSSGAGVLGTTPEQFESAWRTASLGAFVCARETAPDMIAAGGGVMIFTGATSSVRGGGWLAFSSAKFALRGLVQSLARELWPHGVHVAHVVVDGIIGPAGGAKKGEPLLDPDEMAEAYWQLAAQARTAWTLELDLRPHDEKFFE